MKTSTLAILLAMLVAGCASTDELRFDKTERSPSKSVELFHFDAPQPVPDKPYTVIAEMMYMAGRDSEKSVRKYFVNRGRKLGADAVIMISPDNFQAGAHFNSAFYFKAKAIVYR
jgi:hypothetical protein